MMSSPRVVRPSAKPRESPLKPCSWTSPIKSSKVPHPYLSQVGKPLMDLNQSTPTKTAGGLQREDSFITSSPRSTPKTRNIAKRQPRTPTGTMFSPTYPQLMGARVPIASPRQPDSPATPLTPVQKSLQDNVARYGHLDQEFDAYDESHFDPYQFIASLPPLPADWRSNVCIPPKAPNAPPVTLVLDLDETLVHCTTDMNEMFDADFNFEVEFNGNVYQVSCRKRPGFHEFMEHIKGKFETIIFTASQRVYADKLLDLLDPEHEFISHRVFRSDCVCVEGNYLKDLSVLGRDLTKTVIVDNSPQAFSYQLENGVPILSWFDSDADRELYKIIPLLDQLQNANDVRPVLRNKFKLYQRVEERRQKMMLRGLC